MRIKGWDFPTLNDKDITLLEKMVKVRSCAFMSTCKKCPINSLRDSKGLVSCIKMSIANNRLANTLPTIKRIRKLEKLKEILK